MKAVAQMLKRSLAALEEGFLGFFFFGIFGLLGNWGERGIRLSVLWFCFELKEGKVDGLRGS